MGFSRQEYWSGLSLPSPGDHPHLGIELRSPALRANFFPSEPPGKPYQGTCSWYVCLILSALPRKSRMVHPGAGPSEFQALHSPWQERRLEGHTTALKCLHSKKWHLSSVLTPSQSPLQHREIWKIREARVYLVRSKMALPKLQTHISHSVGTTDTMNWSLHWGLAMYFPPHSQLL